MRPKEFFEFAKKRSAKIVGLKCFDRLGASIASVSRLKLGFLVMAAVLVLSAVPVLAADDPAPAKSLTSGLDTVWVLLGAFLVFFMQAGFGMVEAGFIRAKNVCNILTKNFLDYCIASITFFLVGYAFMFGEGNGFIGFSAFALSCCHILACLI